MDLEFKSYISETINEDFGCDVYVLLQKSDEDFEVRKLILEEKHREDITYKFQITKKIKEIIVQKFLSADAEYKSGTDMYDNQNCFYVIKQDDEFCPFSCLNMDDESLQEFQISDLDFVKGFLFKFIVQNENGIKVVWAYQKFNSYTIPNRKKDKQLLFNRNKTNVFEPLNENVLVINNSIDLLIIENTIITNNIKLLERSFKLEKYIRSNAISVVKDIIETDIVENGEKLIEYTNRSNKKYAKKMMQIRKYPVYTMRKEELKEQILKNARWKDSFKFCDDKIALITYKDVENLIDLYTERYTRSDITNQEYDTSVKEKVSNKL